MNLKNFKNKINEAGGVIETFEYDFYDPKNEEAAMEVLVLTVHCLAELENIAERDDAFRRFEKNG